MTILDPGHSMLIAGAAALAGVTITCLLLSRLRRPVVNVEDLLQPLQDDAPARPKYDEQLRELKRLVSSAAYSGANEISFLLHEGAVSTFCEVSGRERVIGGVSPELAPDFIQTIFELTNNSGSTYRASTSEVTQEFDPEGLNFHPDVQSLRLRFFVLEDASEAMVVNLSYKQALVARQNHEVLAA